ncbi:sigma factor-like helix-turn-helix DNA-binding protein [Paenibacillus polymyxa]|jgi:RNA polymerase sigma factor (sigma-70 family)|uniref:sigma factor-like helix-turn-helix DNA-binding protein n=1 Tax=Paenibacillus polymyxa TaxID=1406 RepID=UPI00083E19ED|nr:sigma factor-like helix-turn-helix DNA-binding protein [Paenibacillus polymyxa]APQ59183.1 hypothetical protein VK72_10705 [Paenibacillus polymyxa]ODB60574.1 hypothetical protein A7309_17280 [Paenibacillus polymyxa]VUG03785.1 Bacteriocin UviA [Paenibacillus polymyxa]
MIAEARTKEAVEKAFSSYVKTCLQRSKKDYLEKLYREKAHCISVDAINFEININLLIRSHDILPVNPSSMLSQVMDVLQLTPKEARVLHYKYFEEKTDKEIAQLLGVSRQAISKIKSNFLVKIKRVMEN